MFDHLLEKHKEIRIIQDDKKLIKSSEDTSKIGKEEKEDRAFIKNLIHRNKVITYKFITIWAYLIE